MALNELSKQANIMAVSSKTKETIQKWFEDCNNLWLGAEHGFFYKS
jgi:trehalose-6-phosphatase